MEKIVEWTLAYRNKEDIYGVMCGQIGEFLRNNSCKTAIKQL